MNGQDIIEVLTMLGHSPMNIHIFIHHETDQRWAELDAKLNQIMATQADLDAAIAALPAQIEPMIVTAVDTAVQPIIDAIKAKGGNIDFTPEITSLGNVGASVASAVSAQVASDLTAANP